MYFNYQPKRTYSNEEGEEYARIRIEKVLTDTVYMKSYRGQFGKQVLIDDEATAIKTVEPILFRKYGKEKILNERPYQAFRVNNYWLIKGSFPMRTHFVILGSASHTLYLRTTTCNNIPTA